MIELIVPGMLLKSGEARCSIPLQLRFTFDADADPYAVGMDVLVPGQEPVEWVMGRELLMRGSCNPFEHGVGDVKIHKKGNGVLIHLSNPTGSADLSVPQKEVIRFLNHTQDALHLGDENADEAVDEFLKELFEA
jgi:hypothetical protein